MDKYFRMLQLKQLDDKLAPFRTAQFPPCPDGGWLAAIRNTLGMSGLAMAKRMGLSSGMSVYKYEKAEAQKSITLEALSLCADALGCEVHYALVPKKSLKDIVDERAIDLARQELIPISQGMLLEGQSVGESNNEFQVELLTQRLLDGSWRKLW